MTDPRKIPLDQLSEYFNIGIETIMEFSDFGLFPIIVHEGGPGIEPEVLGRFERIVDLHVALGVNKEGIDVILDLREKISGLLDEIEGLRGVIAELESHDEIKRLEMLSSQGLLIEIE
ncbi:MAG: chaperone modulator CbpM [Spirochaetaceae bacterium]|nr:chaperone modulator CbpM [Spirochaetaceae bacterium]